MSFHGREKPAVFLGRISQRGTAWHRLSREQHAPIIVLVIAQDRKNGESSINSVVSNQRRKLP